MAGGRATVGTKNKINPRLCRKPESPESPTDDAQEPMVLSAISKNILHTMRINKYILYIYIGLFQKLYG